MKRIAVIFLFILVMAVPVSAEEMTAPPAPESVEDLMPYEQESFAQGLWHVFKSAIAELQPDLAEAGQVCFRVFAAVLLICLVNCIPGSKLEVAEFAGSVAVAVMLYQTTDSLVGLGSQTVIELSEYGKLLLPVMTAALAAQGGTTGSVALYAGTAAFDALLCAAISNILMPLVYVFLALSVAGSATGQDSLKKMRDLVKWLSTWCLKIILYIFTGYMSITGVVSGSADAAAVKAAKITISGMIPVVGGILSDASDAVIVGAGVIKNAAGVYGVLAILAVWIAPFLRIGLHYLLLKATAAVCAVFGVKRMSELIQAFSAAMGLLLAMTASVCFLLLISTVCFMRGVG